MFTKKEKECIRIFLAIIALWVVNKLFTHTHPPVLEGNTNEDVKKEGIKDGEAAAASGNKPPVLTDKSGLSVAGGTDDGKEKDNSGAIASPVTSPKEKVKLSGDLVGEEQMAAARERDTETGAKGGMAEMSAEEATARAARGARKLAKFQGDTDPGAGTAAGTEAGKGVANDDGGDVPDVGDGATGDVQEEGDGEDVPFTKKLKNFLGVKDDEETGFNEGPDDEVPFTTKLFNFLGGGDDPSEIGLDE